MSGRETIEAQGKLEKEPECLIYSWEDSISGP